MTNFPRWNGSTWTQMTSTAIMDMSANTTRVWATTATTILDFAP